MCFFLRITKQFNRGYKGLFGQEDEGVSEGIEGDWFSTKWGWYVTLDHLSNSRVVDWDRIVEFKVTTFLNMLSYYKDKQQFEKENMEKNKAKWRNNL